MTSSKLIGVSREDEDEVEVGFFDTFKSLIYVNLNGAKSTSWLPT